MAEKQRRFTGDGRPPSRLQRKAPASLQISPVADWKIAIPLLSPLVTSPGAERIDWASEAVSREETRRPDHHSQAAAEPHEKKQAAKAWQHPAAPFCYEPVPLVQSFVPV